MSGCSFASQNQNKMITEETQNTELDSKTGHKRGNGRILAGLIIVAAGVALLMRNSGFLLPSWLFSWPMFLIVLGLFIGAKHNFKTGGWWIVSLIGTVFLADRFIDGVSIGQLFWPVIIIIVGLAMMFRPKKKWDHKWRDGAWRERSMDYMGQTTVGDDIIESVSVFGGSKKIILSKNFRGGEVVCVFGGSEINLMQADIVDRAELEVVQIFGGTKLIVPPHWVVSSDMVTIFGSVDDKRPIVRDRNNTETTKTLVIKGTSIFGGVDIRSY